MDAFSYGGERAGVYVLLANAMEMIKLDGEVDLINLTLIARLAKPQILSTPVSALRSTWSV